MKSDKDLIDLFNEMRDQLYKEMEDWRFEDNDGDAQYFSFSFEKGDIYVEAEFECHCKWLYSRGGYWEPSIDELDSAWGETTKVTASYYDEEKEDYIEFEGEVIDDLGYLFDKAVEVIYE